MKAIIHGHRWEMAKAREVIGHLSRSRVLLMCGWAAAVVYVAANVIAPLMYPGYDWMSQTVSELSAIGAPTRDLWVWMMVAFGVLLVVFGVGVYATSFSGSLSPKQGGPLFEGTPTPGSAPKQGQELLDGTTTPVSLRSTTPPKQGGEPAGISDLGLRIADLELQADTDREKLLKRMRIVGLLLMFQGVVGFFWPPMHMRGAEMTLTDTLHIAFTFVVVPVMMLSIWFSRDVVGRVYAYVTLVLVVGFGLLTGLDGPNIAANLPTPYVGLWERISIAAWVTWLAVFSVRCSIGSSRRNRWRGGGAA